MKEVYSIGAGEPRPPATHPLPPCFSTLLPRFRRFSPTSRPQAFLFDASASTTFLTSTKLLNVSGTSGARKLTLGPCLREPDFTVYRFSTRFSVHTCLQLGAADGKSKSDSNFHILCLFLAEINKRWFNDHSGPPRLASSDRVTTSIVYVDIHTIGATFRKASRGKPRSNNPRLLGHKEAFMELGMAQQSTKHTRLAH